MTKSFKHPICTTYGRAPMSNHICFILAQYPIVMAKTYQPPLNPLENLHVNHAPALRAAISLTGRKFLKNATQHGNTLRTTYNVILYCYWQHHGITRRRCLTGCRQNHGQTVFGFLAEILVFAWRNSPQPRLELPATSHMHIRSLDLTRELAFYAPFALEHRGFSFTLPFLNCEFL